MNPEAPRRNPCDILQFKNSRPSSSQRVPATTSKVTDSEPASLIDIPDKPSPTSYVSLRSSSLDCQTGDCQTTRSIPYIGTPRTCQARIRVQHNPSTPDPCCAPDALLQSAISKSCRGIRFCKRNIRARSGTEYASIRHTWQHSVDMSNFPTEQVCSQDRRALED